LQISRTYREENKFWSLHYLAWVWAKPFVQAAGLVVKHLSTRERLGLGPKTTHRANKPISPKQFWVLEQHLSKKAAFATPHLHSGAKRYALMWQTCRRSHKTFPGLEVWKRWTKIPKRKMPFSYTSAIRLLRVSFKGNGGSRSVKKACTENNLCPGVRVLQSLQPATTHACACHLCSRILFQEVTTASNLVTTAQERYCRLATKQSRFYLMKQTQRLTERGSRHAAKTGFLRTTLSFQFIASSKTVHSNSSTCVCSKQSCSEEQCCCWSTARSAVACGMLITCALLWFDLLLTARRVY